VNDEVPSHGLSIRVLLPQKRESLIAEVALQALITLVFVLSPPT
jgi:hypothetical protein